MQALTPNGTLILFLALIGASSLLTWIIALAGKVLDDLRPAICRSINQWKTNRGIRRALKRQSMTAREREVMQQGAAEALDAFRRAELAFFGACSTQISKER